MSAPITLPTGPDRAIWVWVVLPRVCSTPRISIAWPGCFPTCLARGDAYRVRLVQRDDDATAFDAEYLSQREAAAEDLMLACRMTRGVASDLLVRAASVIPADELAAACDRALELGLATWVPDKLEGHAGRCHLGRRYRRPRPCSSSAHALGLARWKCSVRAVLGSSLGRSGRITAIYTLL